MIATAQTPFKFCGITKKSGTSQPVKPFCKVCHDTGKTESEYTSHFVRERPDATSKVVCPTLLALSCNFCHMKGHTVSKCHKRMDFEQNKNNKTKATKLFNSTKPTKATKLGGRFDLLIECEKDEVEIEGFTGTQHPKGASCERSSLAKGAVNVLEQFPALTKGSHYDESMTVSTSVSVITNMPSYKEILERPVEISSDYTDKESIETTESMFEYKYSKPGSWSGLLRNPWVDDSTDRESIETFCSMRKFKYSKPGSWADDSDSDEE